MCTLPILCVVRRPRLQFVSRLLVWFHQSGSVSLASYSLPVPVGFKRRLLIVLDVVM